MPAWRKLFALLGVWWLSVTVVCAATPVGTAIVNQAIMTYIDQATGELVELRSNTSNITVAKLAQFELLSSSDTQAYAGSRVVFLHTLSNLGNVDGRYALSVENLLADDGDLINLLLYVDVNQNGVIEPGEPIADAEVALEPGDALSLIVTGVVPPELKGEAEIQVELHARSIDTELAPQSNIDSVYVEPEADIELSLNSSTSCDQSVTTGDVINYQFLAKNITNTLPDTQTIILDGEAKDGVIMQVELPNALQLKKEAFLDVMGFQAIAMVQDAGDGDQWMRYDHWTEESDITKLALLVPAEEFALNEPVSVAFSMVVKSLDASITDYVVGSVIASNRSDASLHSIRSCFDAIAFAEASPISIRFVEPLIELQRENIVPDFDADTVFQDASVYRLNVQTDSEDSFLRLGSDGSSTQVDYTLAGQGVYVELDAIVHSDQIITADSGADFVVVSVSSALTGDNTELLLRETATNSNRYRSIRPILLSSQLRADGSYCPGGKSGALPTTPDYESDVDICVLQSDFDDKLNVSFVDEPTGAVYSDLALVEPISRVFDSTSLVGVANAQVTLFKGDTVVTDPISDEAIILITDSEGRYSLPRLLPGSNYRIEVQPPSSHVFPSTVSAERFTSYQVSNLSYGVEGFNAQGGGEFSVQSGEAPPVVDIPLDPENRNTLLQVEKSADVNAVELGDTVAYSIKVINRSTGELSNVAVIDNPAYGFRFVPGSASFNGDRIADPQRLKSPTDGAIANDSGAAVNTSLRFIVSQIAAESEGVLRYRMQATAGAADGVEEGVNRANGNANTVSGLLLSTPTSVATVKIERSGVLSDQAILFGKVYVDSSCDNIQNQGEWPIAGVRLYMQDGTFVVTDEDGQFSLYGLQPGLHVLKLDSTTLPQGLVLKPTDTRQAADPDSRFVELSAGDFHRADFAAYCPQQNAAHVFDELKKRNADLRNAWLLNEASQYNLDGAHAAQDERKRADTDGDLSHGLLGFRRDLSDQAKLPDALGLGLAGDSTTENQQRDQSETPVKMGDPQELVKTITLEQAKAGTWLWPHNDLSWDGRFMVVVREGITPVLYVNDVAIDGSQIGERIVNRQSQAQLVAWYGVRLLPGSNRVEVRGVDPFGNERILASSVFKKPSAGVRLLLRSSQDTLEADGGRSVIPIEISISDAFNNPASGVYFVTLSSTGGDFVEADLQPTQPGLQVRVENGRGLVHLRSTEQTGNVSVQASTGALDGSLNVVQIAAARPLIGAGLIDIGGQWNRVDKGAAANIDLEDEFTTDARAALFLKGRIKNDYQLTLSYDSDKNKSVDVLRDLNPNEHYATYGDSSLRGVEAQSRSKLYLKIEKNRNSLMWGDYITDNYSNHDDLARVQRTLTGINSVLANDKTRLQIFAADENTVNKSEEIPGNGTTMLYQLQGAPAVVNSEYVERIVRDRFNTGLVISSETLQRYTDYELDYVTGNIQFRDVIPTVDENLNPVSIRISYDTQGSGDKYLVSGLRLLHEFNPNLSLAFSVTDDQNPLDGYTIGGVTAIAKLTHNTKLTATAAVQTHNDGRSDGNAQRATISHNWHGRRDYRTVMTWARASANFDNAAAGISAGRDEWRIEHRHPINNTLKARANITHSVSAIDQSSYSSAGLEFDKTFTNWSLSFGGRHIQNKDRSQKYTFNTMLVGMEKRFSIGKSRRGSIGFDYEQAIGNSGRHRLGLSARLQLHKNISSYARYELDKGILSHSVSQGSGNRLFTFGVESDVLPHTTLYSEYRLRGNYSGESMETASGIRGRYELKPKLTLSPSFEVINVMEGQGAQDSIALSLGITDKRNINRKLSAQAELRETESTRYYGFRGSIAQRLSTDWTGLVREEFTRQTPDTGQLTSRHRFTLGLANRPKRNNTYHALYMANWKMDYGPEDGMDKESFLLSTHQNRQIADNATLSGRFGARWSRTLFDSGAQRSHVVLGDLRASFHINRRWELDLRGGWLGTGGPGDGKYSAGLGVSWIADRNLRLGINYNAVGFKEEDLDEQGYNAQGLRLGLQLKFDEDWFRWLE